MKRLLLTIGLVALAGWAPVAAQEAPPSLTDNTAVEEVVVVARRIGVPVWRITRGPSTVVLVADADVPAGGSWRPEQLEAAVKGARSMFVPEIVAKGGDRSEVARFRAVERKALQLDTAVLEPQLQARLARLAASGKLKRHQTQSVRRTARRLIDASIGARRRVEDGSNIAIRAAKKHRVKRTPFAGFTISDLSETADEARAREIACLASTVDLAEQPLADARRRLEAWRRVDVPALAGSRLEAVRRSCSGLAGSRYLKTQAGVEAALRGALAEPGATVAVIPLWSLADPSGLLDRLGRDHAIDGPRWRPLSD